MKTLRFLAVTVATILLMTACKKDEPDNNSEEKQAFLPRTITISGAVLPGLNGTIHFEYNNSRQISSIKRVSKSGNEELNWIYTYDNQKRPTNIKYSIENALSSPSRWQTDYTYEYAGNTPVKVSATSTSNLGDTDAFVENITNPQSNRFFLWATNYIYNQAGDLENVGGSLLGGYGLSATYSDKKGVFSDVQMQAVHYFFLNGTLIPDMLFLAQKELKTINVGGHPATISAGEYNSISAERNAQNCITRYIIKNDTKTYAQFDIEYITVQLN
ncbi:MAG TPA: hypothetical protein PKE30_19010 [Niabella sp.]|nr:hypothetical protein [Niabella sp.]